MRALGEAGAKEFGLTEQDMENLFTEYWVSEKLVEQLTEGMNLEVSDSEAKVITVSQIELSDEGRAREVLSRLSEEGADFSSIAKEYSEDPEMKKQIFYGLKAGNMRRRLSRWLRGKSARSWRTPESTIF